jgi:hypothetical protein
MEPRILTVEETPAPEQQTALLPADTLKQVFLEEFRLQGETDSLKAFVDLCFLENEEYIKNRIVWITENAFVRIGSDFGLPCCYRERQFRLNLSTTADVHSSDHDISIHSSTTKEAIAALDLLVGLQDSHFKWIELQYFDREYSYGSLARTICPFTKSILEKIVSNANRENRFGFMVFTPDQCRTLSSCGIRTNIGFLNCEFDDGGIAFVEASAARENQDSGPAKLSIWTRLVFDEVNFRLFLSQHNLESMMLY